LSLGPGVFVVIAAFTLLIKGQLLKYPPMHAGHLILFVEIMATISIGVTLAALFLGGYPKYKK